jgi:ribosomal protein S21
MQDKNYHQQQLMEIPSTFEKRKKQQKKQQLARSTFSLFLFVRFFFS